MAKTFEFHVEMTCEGCVNAVKRILDKAKGEGGVVDYKVDLPLKLVAIQSRLEEDDITKIIAKCGKDVTLKSVTEN